MKYSFASRNILLGRRSNIGQLYICLPFVLNPTLIDMILNHILPDHSNPPLSDLTHQNHNHNCHQYYNKQKNLNLHTNSHSFLFLLFFIIYQVCGIALFDVVLGMIFSAHHAFYVESDGVFKFLDGGFGCGLGELGD